MNPTKKPGWTQVIRKGSSPCSTSGIRRVNLVTSPMISHKWGKDRKVFTTSGPYPWSKVTFWWDYNYFRFAIDQHVEWDFYRASSLKQQSAVRHVALIAHIILIPSQPDFAHTPKFRVLSGEATITNCIVFGLTLLG